MTQTYISEAFNPKTMENAKNTVLSVDKDNPDKFVKETQYLIEVLNSEQLITESTAVMDFGCGMGRVSRELISTFNCDVFGVDTSHSMLKFAREYVNNFSKFHPYFIYNKANSIDIAISCFVLQHVQYPEKEIDFLFNVLKPGGILVLVNEPGRYIPGGVDKNGFVIWTTDNVDIIFEVGKRFTEIKRIPYLTSELDIIFYKKEV